MESEEHSEDETDVTMYEKEVGCDWFYSLYGWRCKNMTVSFGLGSVVGVQHCTKR